MTAVLPISANHDVLGFYHKQKSEFHFQDKSDNEFLMFLLDTAVRVISIVQHLAPVIEAVSDASNDDESFVEESNTSKNMEYDDLDKMVEEVQQLTTTPPPTNSIPSLPNAKPPELNVTAPPQPVLQVSHNQPVPLPEATIGISSSSGAGTSSCGGDESSNVAASSASTTLPPISSLEPLSHPSPMNTDEQSQQDPNQQQEHKHSHRENVPELVTVKDEILEQSEPPVSEQTPILGQDTINQLMSSLSSSETCIPNLVTTAQPSSLSNSLSNNALSMLNLASTSNSINNLFGSKTSGSSSADNLAGPSRVDSSTLRSLSDIKGFPNLSDASGAAASATPSSSGNPKSKSQSTVKKTESDVQYFQQFLQEIEGVAVPMKDLPEDELVKHMSTFFNGVKKRRGGKDYEPTTLWSMYASLKRHLTEVNYSFEGSRHITEALAPVTEVVKAASRKMKKKGMGNLPNASDAISNAEVMKLYEDKIAGRHNPLALNNAMVINLMFLGFRGRQELYTTMLGDLKIVTVDSKKELHIAKERATKIRNGVVPKAMRFGLPTLAATGGLDCPVKAFEELKSRRPLKFQHDDSPLFLRPSTTDPKYALPVGKFWYYNARVGVNFISKMTKSMMLLSDVDTTGRNITNTSCRKIMATTMIKKDYS